MFKVALIVVITSISNPEKPPEVSLSSLYQNIDACYKVMDELIESINAIEDVNVDGEKILKMYNREYHHQSVIYWSCEKLPKTDAN